MLVVHGIKTGTDHHPVRMILGDGQHALAAVYTALIVAVLTGAQDIVAGGERHRYNREQTIGQVFERDQQMPEAASLSIAACQIVTLYQVIVPR